MEFKELKKKDGEWRYKLSLLLKLKEENYISDSLSILLNDFSHKRPQKEGPTKATAYLTLKKDNDSEEVSLSITGKDGQTKMKNESIVWHRYKIELVEFNYDQSIKINIYKN